MPDATPEPRVSDERLAQHIEAYQGRAGTAWVAFIALDLRDARATIASQAEALAAMTTERDKAVAMVTASSEVAAEHHRMRKAAEAALKAAREALEAAKEWADRVAGDERVCGWVHQNDYGLYCLLADCPVDFDAALTPTKES